MRAKFKRETYSLFMFLGHLCCDINSGALPAVLPFLMVNKGITYAQAAGLTFALSSLGSVIQPLFGIMSDKQTRPWMMSIGIFLAGCGISILGWLDSYWMMFLAVALTGVGSALFHPDGGRMANFVAGEHKGRGISNFSVGGNFGGIIGPALVLLGINLAGMKGTIILAVPSFAMAAFLFTQNRCLSSFANEGKQTTATANKAGQKDDWIGFFKLTGVVFLRSILVTGITTFIPLFWLNVLMQSENVSSMTTSIIAFTGAAATLIGGRLGDRIGFNRVIHIGLALTGPCLAVIVLSDSVLLSTIMLIPMTMVLYISFSPAVAMGQNLIPNHIGLASGMTMGLASSFGGVVSPLLGTLGDNVGLTPVLWILVVTAVLAGAMSFLVPNAPPQPNKMKV